jgi:hypothetical protein
VVGSFHSLLLLPRAYKITTPHPNPLPIKGRGKRKPMPGDHSLPFGCKPQPPIKSQSVAFNLPSPLNGERD